MSHQLQLNSSTIDELITKINALPSGGGTTLPELTNEGSDIDLVTGKELINSSGEVVTGTNPYAKAETDAEVSTQADLISQIQTALASKTSVSPTLQEKTVTPTTSVQNVTPDSGYDGLSKVTVNAIPSTYVQPTSTKTATTYTPSTADQTIAAGTYCSGVQTIKGDANLKAENIASGVSIFGVTGTHSGGSSGGGGSVETCTVAVRQDGPLSPMPTYPTFYYTDENLSIKTLTRNSADITIAKNTVIAISGWSGMCYAEGSCEEIFHASLNAAYKVTGDCTMYYAE